MPTPYSGVAGATQSPSPQPAERRVPIVNIPTGGDRGAAVWTQPLKVIADWIAFVAASFPTAPVGALLRVSVIASGTSLAKSSGCSRARVRLVGGGGGGAGATSPGFEIGGGGAAGGYCEWFTAVIPATWTFSIGAAGAAGTGAPTNGGNGGNTTFSNGVTTVTAFGGGGGKTGSITTALQGAAAAISTNGTLNGSGDPGDSPAFLGGQGGSSLLGGAGGRVVNLSSSNNNGNPGIGFGAGGSGGSVYVGAAATGGAGTAGAIVLEEYS